MDIEDALEDYSDDFDDGNEDFAVGRVTGLNADFVVATPNGFENNGLESGHSFSGGETYRTIFQKPIIIPSTGSTLSFDEIAFIQPGNDFGFGLNFSESIVLEATNNRGKSWFRIAQYSAEDDEDWENASDSNLDVASDLYRKRKIKLSDIFEEGDEVYFKLEMNVFGFPFAWGYILDNFTVESTVSTQEQAIENNVSMKTFNNPFVNSTKVEIKVPNSIEIGKAVLIGLNGQIVETSIQESNKSDGKIYNIDGSSLASGVYFFKVRVGTRIMTEKLVKI